MKRFASVPKLRQRATAVAGDLGASVGKAAADYPTSLRLKPLTKKGF